MPKSKTTEVIFYQPFNFHPAVPLNGNSSLKLHNDHFSAAEPSVFVNGKIRESDLSTVDHAYRHITQLFNATSVGLRKIWIADKQMPEKLTKAFINRWGPDSRHHPNNTRIFVPNSHEDNAMVTVVEGCGPARFDERDYHFYEGSEPNGICHNWNGQHELKMFVFAAALIPKDRDVNIQLWHGRATKDFSARTLGEIEAQGVQKVNLSALEGKQKWEIIDQIKKTYTHLPDLGF